jgi:uncharacterized domain
MNEYYTTKCKDSGPLQTINRIRGLLGELGILAKETWNHQVEGFYSVNIRVGETTLHTNGKGTTPEYALASGYGEFMERLQNFYFENMKMDIGTDVLKYRNFYYVPDERHLSIDEILECNDTWAKVFTLNAGTREEKAEILKEWLIEDNTGKPSDFISVPFLNAADGSIHYLPRVMLLSLYGSNGMCAGNTPEEALVQGFSEVMERYAHDMVARKKTVPPTVPRSYLEQYPVIYEMIRKIEQEGNFKVITKDCSMGMGFPVIAILFVDMDRHTYSVRFGAHPLFEIAVERCLTELLQGRDFTDMYWVDKFSYFGRDRDSSRNYKKQLTTAIGDYDPSLFSDHFSYPFKGFNTLETYHNKRMIDYLYDILREKGYDILIRDVSFLGFPSYHVIVPFFSEIPDLTLETVRSYSTAVKMKKVAKNPKHCPDEELQELVDYMLYSDDKLNRDDYLINVTSLPTMRKFPTVSRDPFAAHAYYRMGKLKKAYEIMDHYIQGIETNKKSNYLTLMKCMRDYIGMRADGIDDGGSIKSLLTVFYPENVVCRIMDDFEKKEDVLKYCESLKCYDCGECEWKSCCRYPEMKKIHMRLKDSYAGNIIDQRRIMDVLHIEPEGSE